MNRFMMGIYTLCKWITYFFYLNVLWVGFTLLGGVVFGAMPSTIALYAIARKTAMGEEDIPLIQTFWKIYRFEILRSNGLSYSLLLSGYLIYFNLMFFRSFEGIFYSFMSFAMLLLVIVFIMLLLYIFPVYVHYQLGILQYIKQALKIAFLHPLNAMSIIITTVATYYFFIYLPGFIPLFGISILCHLNMWLAHQSFQSIERMKLKEQIGGALS